MSIFSRFFPRTPPGPNVSPWWADANVLVDAPTKDGVAALRASAVREEEAPDLAEAQQEMLDALDALLELAARPDLPVAATQHRVIGADTCHYLTPASLVDQLDAGGKVFVTSARLIFAAGTVLAWPWYLVTRVRRVERDLIVELKGRAPVGLRLNTYEDAVVICHLAAMLLRQARPNRP